jgi:hypothetical protein
MQFLYGLLIGGLCGVLLERAIGHPIDHFVIRPISTAWRHRRNRKTGSTLGVDDELIVVAGSALFVHQFVPRGFAHRLITAQVDSAHSGIEQRLRASSMAGLMPQPEVLEERVKAWFDLLEADPHYWNGSSLALTRCDVTRVGDSEDSALNLVFRDGDYATLCAIDEQWKSIDINARRAMDGDSLRKVDPLLSNSFGLNCTIETDDGAVLLTRRSELARDGANRAHISFNEGLSALDRRPGGGVDILGAFARGMHEELGISASQIPDFTDRLTVHTLMLDVDLYQWGLLAHLDLDGTRITSDTIRISRNLGAAPDDWEAAEIWTLPFSNSADSVLAELKHPRPWIAHGLLNLALSTAHRHPARAGDIRLALARAT